MDNINKTFDTFDKFGLKPFADQLMKYLKVEAQFAEGSFVLSLNSEFGSGKTTFLEMWQEKLKTEETPPKVVYLNAWQSDFQGDALLSIISGLLDALGSSIEKPEKESIKETAGKLSKFALSIGNDVVNKFTGIDFIKAGERAEDGNLKKETTLGHACFEVYYKRQEIFNELKSQLRNLTKESKTQIIIIIDELDRCRPTYAIEFLETIKHFFDIKGLIFVLGVDKVQLKSSAEALFGSGLKFDEYYRKFAHRNVSLPVKSKEITRKFCSQLIDEYLSLEAFQNKQRFTYIDYGQYKEEILEICNSFSLNARQLHELFRTAAHAFSSLSETERRLRWGWLFGSLFMITIGMKDDTIYHQIGRKEITLKEFTSYLRKLNLIKNNSTPDIWWANLLYTGVFSVKSPDKLKEEFAEFGVKIDSNYGDEAFNEQLDKFNNDAYGRSLNEGSAFSEIYKTLEGLKTFAGS
ncbi:MAG: hypothetical protein JW787_02400 [Sedimentisphaerales bacterium]|nr:hypothetical protein [Sedimentisphaerales bacterium]